MFTKTLGFGLATIATLGLAACSGSSKQDAVNATDSTVNADGLMGSYTSACTNVPGSVLGLSSYNVKYVIDGHMDKYITYYSSNDCQNEVLDIHTVGEYSSQGNLPAADGVPDKTDKINYTFKHEIVTPKTQALVDAMNAIPGGYCGITNWSVTGTDATPADRKVDPLSGDAIRCFGTEKLASFYDLINTQNHQLHFGEATLINDKSTDAKRPTTVDQTVIGTN